MMKPRFTLLFFSLVFIQPAIAIQDLIAFGSCIRQSRPVPILDTITGLKPRLFVLTGDNVYADSTDPARIQAAYDTLGVRPEYRRLRDNIPILATWDDHDYGLNDAGSELPVRVESETIFHTFFNTPADHPVRGRPGVYRAETIGEPGRRIQIILLDTRYFRGPLRHGPGYSYCPRRRYVPNLDQTVTMLGDAQWRWLEEQLRVAAELRIIVSSIQLIPRQHCLEKWANLPHERSRLFGLIKRTGAEGVVIVSGDRHMGEISRLPASIIGYPLYELTSSGLNTAGAGKGMINNYRTTPDNFRGDNAGLVRVDWDPAGPVVELAVIDVTGKTVIAQPVPLAGLKFGADY